MLLHLRRQQLLLAAEQTAGLEDRYWGR